MYLIHRILAVESLRLVPLMTSPLSMRGKSSNKIGNTAYESYLEQDTNQDGETEDIQGLEVYNATENSAADMEDRNREKDDKFRAK